MTRRLLLVADAAVADVNELPPGVRAVIDEASEVYVVTPTMPSRLAWLAWELIPSRYAADERLEAVLDQMRSIDVQATGTIGDDSILTAFADAIDRFQPDHILIGLRSSEHSNWQERGLIKRVEQRFELPVMTFCLDPSGHVSAPLGADN